MIIKSLNNVFKIIPIIQLEMYKDESNLFVPLKLLQKIITILKNHFNYNFKILTCISGVDYPENQYRFKIVYELLSLKFNLRLRIKVLTDYLFPVDSVKNTYINASWWESEIWDMFGVFFLNHSNLTRILTDYGFEGYPLRKDFPLIGFSESRYHSIKNRVVYETLELAQEYRTFEFLSPWEK